MPYGLPISVIAVLGGCLWLGVSGANANPDDATQNETVTDETTEETTNADADDLIPHTFVPNTPAKADEVNANFAVLAQSIHDLRGRLAPIEALLDGVDFDALATVLTDIDDLRTAVVALQTDVDGLQTNVADLKTDVETLLIRTPLSATATALDGHYAMYRLPSSTANIATDTDISALNLTFAPDGTFGIQQLAQKQVATGADPVYPRTSTPQASNMTEGVYTLENASQLRLEGIPAQPPLTCQLGLDAQMFMCLPETAHTTTGQGVWVGIRTNYSK